MGTSGPRAPVGLEEVCILPAFPDVWTALVHAQISLEVWTFTSVFAFFFI